MPSCTKDDGKTSCKPNCDCFRSLEIGMQIYDKGGVQSFNQFGNHLIGYLIEQQTDPKQKSLYFIDLGTSIFEQSNVGKQGTTNLKKMAPPLHEKKFTD